MSYIAEAHGTPMAVKTPINFLARKNEAKEANKKSLRKLFIVSFVSVFFIAAQVTGGILSNSIAIFTDTAHLASDLVGFGISIASLTIAQRKASTALSFGWHRAEVIGTLVSVIGLQILTIWLVYEATLRFFDPPVIDGPIMLITAVAGLFFNLIQMKILHSGDGHYHLGGGHDHSHGDHDHGHDHAHNHSHSHAHPKKATKTVDNEPLREGLINDEEGHVHHHEHDHEHGEDHHHDHPHEHNHDGHSHGPSKGSKKSGEKKNINVESAYLHVLGDMLMSVGVIIAGVIIYFFPDMWYADPICTYLFSFIVIFTTTPIQKDCIRVMMEGTPHEIDADQLLEDLYAIQGVEEIHDFHVWSISVGKFALSAHIKSDQPLKVLSVVTDLLRRQYNIYHTTVQMEGFTENRHSFKCENDIHD